MAEGLANYTRDDDIELQIGSTQGRTMSNADEVRVVNDEDRDVSPCAVGHLLTLGLPMPYAAITRRNSTTPARSMSKNFIVPEIWYRSYRPVIWWWKGALKIRSIVAAKRWPPMKSKTIC